MPYVVLKRMKVGQRFVERGETLTDEDVQAWRNLDAYLRGNYLVGAPAIERPAGESPDTRLNEYEIMRAAMNPLSVAATTYHQQGYAPRQEAVLGTKPGVAPPPILTEPPPAEPEDDDEETGDDDEGTDAEVATEPNASGRRRRRASAEEGADSHAGRSDA